MAGILPPGARGYLLGEESMQRQGMNQMNQITGVLALRQALEQQAQAAQQQQAIQSLIPQLTDPSARMLAQAGDFRGAISRQFPAPRQPVVVGPGASLVDPSNPDKSLFTSPTKEPKTQTSELGKLIEERDALPAGDMRRIPYDAKIKKLTAMEPTPSRIPAGFRPTPDGNLEAIPGGPADMRQQGMFNQDTALLNNTTSALDRLAAAANDVMTSPGVGRITGMAGSLPNVPGMAGADTAAKLQTLKAQVGFNVLQEMRNASKTGGALGQVTEKELGFLQNALSALDTSQSEDQFKESLQKIIEYAAGAKARLNNAFNMKHKKSDDKDPLGLFK